MLDRTVDRQRGWVKLPCGGWWVDIFTSAMLCTSTMGDGQLGGLAKCNAFLNCLLLRCIFLSDSNILQEVLLLHGRCTSG